MVFSLQCGLPRINPIARVQRLRIEIEGIFLRTHCVFQVVIDPQSSRAPCCPKNCNGKRKKPEVVCTLHSPKKFKVNYEPPMGRTILNWKKWNSRLQKKPTRFPYCNCCTMIVYVCFYEGKDVKLDVSCFGVVVWEAQSYSLQDSRKLMAILLSVER